MESTLRMPAVARHPVSTLLNSTGRRTDAYSDPGRAQGAPVLGAPSSLEQPRPSSSGALGVMRPPEDARRCGQPVPRAPGNQDQSLTFYMTFKGTVPDWSSIVIVPSESNAAAGRAMLRATLPQITSTSG